MTGRYISSLEDQTALRRAVKSWLVAEFIRLRGTGSGTIRIVSAWLTASQVIESNMSWDGILPTPLSSVRSTLDLLEQYVLLGGKVDILVRWSPSDPATQRTRAELAVWPGRALAGVRILASPREHTKLWVGELLAFEGSANMTHHGLEQNRELMHVVVDDDQVKRLRELAVLALSQRDATPLFQNR